MKRQPPIIAFALLAILTTCFDAQQLPPPPVTRLSLAVQQAKLEGKKEIHLPTPTVYPTGVESVDALLSEYSLLRVRVLDSVVSHDDVGIYTWYKLSVLETIRKQSDIPQDDLPAGVPPAFLPLTSSELLYVVPGGQITVDGITVVEAAAEGGLFVKKGNEYVGGFFLEAGGSRATPTAGAAALYAVQGDMLIPQRSEEHPLVKEMRSLYGNRLSAIRADAVKRGFTADHK